MKLAIGIAHAAFLPERRESLARLLAQLKPQGIEPHVSSSTEREHARVWAPRLWSWAAEENADATILLNDDVDVCPHLVAMVGAMVQAVPGEIVSLHCQLPAARSILEAGGRWLRSYWLSGPGYVLPRGDARKLLDWLASTPETVLRTWNEDGYGNLFAWGRRRPIWHCLPALVQHRTDVPSTLGYDAHPMRKASVAWDDPIVADRFEAWSEPETWRPPTAPPFIPCPWMGERELSRIEAERDSTEKNVRIFIATPMRDGEVRSEYAASIWRLARARAFGIEYVQIQQQLENVVRARSRFVRTFLESSATHLLFVDADQEFAPQIVPGLLATGRDFVAAPYPMRQGVNFERVVAMKPDTALGAESMAYDYHVRPLPQADRIAVDEQCCVEVAAIGLGCALITRACLEQMWEHYGAELDEIDLTRARQFEGVSRNVLEQRILAMGDELARWRSGSAGLVFRDEVAGKVSRTVALFQLWNREGDLLSEDTALCERWRAMGGKVWMYLGQGSPVHHHGHHAYRGHLEAFGFTRADKKAAG